MSLFQFGFKRLPRNLEQSQSENDQLKAVPDHMPSVPDHMPSVGRDEHARVVAAASDLADPSPAKKRRI